MQAIRLCSSRTWFRVNFFCTSISSCKIGSSQTMTWRATLAEKWPWSHMQWCVRLLLLLHTPRTFTAWSNSMAKTSPLCTCNAAQLATCQGHLLSPQTPAPKYQLSAIKYLDDASFMKIRFSEWIRTNLIIILKYENDGILLETYFSCKLCLRSSQERKSYGIDFL